MATTTHEFSTPTLVGDRFETDSPSIPVDALTELVAYQEIVVELAKEMARERTRTGRLPKGFTNKFELRLTSIQKGSAVARLERVVKLTGEEHPLFTPGQDVFDEARDTLTDAIESFESRGKLPDTFPTNVIPLFKKFGRNLRDGESIVLRPARDGRRAVAYTPETRKRLVLLTSDTYTREVQLTGTIVRQDAQKRQFWLDTKEQGVIEVAYPERLHPVISNALRDYKFTRIQVAGIAQFNSKDVFQEFDGVPTVTLESDLSEADVQDVENRLKEFEELESGWLDGEDGEVPSKEGLGWLRGIILALMASYKVPLPYLYPTPEGGVQAEWSFKPWEVSAEFNLLKRSAYLHAVKGKTRETEVEEVTFEENENKALEKTAGFVLRIKEREGRA